MNNNDFFATEKTLGNLRTLSMVEGISLLLLLFVAMPLKYVAGLPQAVSIVGMIHGLLFMALVIMIFLVGSSRNWTKGFMVFAVLMASLPLGMLILDGRLKKMYQS